MTLWKQSIQWVLLIERTGSRTRSYTLVEIFFFFFYFLIRAAVKLDELYLTCKAVGPLCALFTASEPVATVFSRSSHCEFSQMGSTHFVITPSPGVLQLISSWGQAPSVLCCLTPTIKVCERKYPAVKVPLIVCVFVFLMNQRQPGKWTPKDIEPVLY